MRVETISDLRRNVRRDLFLDIGGKATIELQRESCVSRFQESLLGLAHSQTILGSD